MEKRYIGLDLFRIWACIMVCAFHTTIHLECNYGVLQEVSQMGAIFMTAFFMLSGFALYVNYRNIDLCNITQIKKYAIKRFWSIMPFYYICSILYYITQGRESVFQDIVLIPMHLLGLQSMLSSLCAVSHHGGTWFISCIIICYMIYPYIQKIVRQLTIKMKVLIVFVLWGWVLYTPFLLKIFNTKLLWVEYTYANPLFRLIEFAIGVTIAALSFDIEQCKYVRVLFSWKAIVVEALCYVLAVTLAMRLKIGVGDYMLYSAWIGIPIFSIMLFSLKGIQCKFLDNSKVIRYMSSLAYSFYMAQLFSNWVCKAIIKEYNITDNWHRILLGWGTCILIAVMLHEIVEKRIIAVIKEKSKK